MEENKISLANSLGWFGVIFITLSILIPVCSLIFIISPFTLFVIIGAVFSILYY